MFVNTPLSATLRTVSPSLALVSDIKLSSYLAPSSVKKKKESFITLTPDFPTILLTSFRRR